MSCHWTGNNFRFEQLGQRPCAWVWEAIHCQYNAEYYSHRKTLLTPSANLSHFVADKPSGVPMGHHS